MQALLTYRFVDIRMCTTYAPLHFEHSFGRALDAHLLCGRVMH